MARGMEKEPAFAWWGTPILAKRNRIIASVNKRYHKRDHKFGIKVPRYLKKDINFDNKNGNALWKDAVQKEMTNVEIAFKVLDSGDSIPPCYQ